MKNTLFALAAAVTVVVSTPAFSQNRVIDQVDDRTASLIYYHLAGVKPDVASLVKESREYRQADEFDRDDVFQRLMKEYDGITDEVTGVEQIVLRTGGKLGQYDGNKEGFPIGEIRPNTYFPFENVFSGGKYNIHIRTDRSADFAFFPAVKDDARTIAKKFGSSHRPIEIWWYLNITGVKEKGKMLHLSAHLIETEIEKVEIRPQHNPSEVLGTIKPEKKIEIKQEFAVLDKFDPYSVKVDGFELGMTAEDVIKMVERKKISYAELRSPVSYYDLQKAHKDGYMEKKAIAPYNTRTAVLSYKGSCNELEAYDNRYDDDGKKPEQHCVVLSFDKGEEGFFGGTPSKITSIRIITAIKNDDKEADTTAFFEKYGKSPFVDTSGMVENQFGWGNNGNGKHLKTYDLGLSYWSSDKRGVYKKTVSLKDNSKK